jgi:hypothetical protein
MLMSLQSSLILSLVSSWVMLLFQTLFEPVNGSVRFCHLRGIEENRLVKKLDNVTQLALFEV